MLTDGATDCSGNRSFRGFSLTGSSRADLRDESGIKIGKGPDAGLCALARIQVSKHFQTTCMHSH